MGLLYPLRESEPPIVIDNRKLDGFIDRFLEQGCTDLDCETCLYCHRWADRAVRIDPEYHQDVLSRYRALFESLQTGRFWRWQPGDIAAGARKLARVAAETAAEVEGDAAPQRLIRAAGQALRDRVAPPPAAEPTAAPAAPDRAKGNGSHGSAATPAI